MNKTTLLIFIIFIVLMILLFLLSAIIKNRKKKLINNTIDKLNTEKNLIISSTLITELDKAEKLANNKKLQSDVENWKKRFEEIEKIDMPFLTDELVDAETYLENKENDKASDSLINAEKDIYHIKAKSFKLLNEIRDLTESEYRNREAVTKLKCTYREIVFKYNKNRNDYEGINDRIELQFENIDKLFSGFEVAIQNKNYEEFGKIVKALNDLINNINIVIDEAPTIILISKMILPKKMKDIENTANKLKLEGYNIEYLNLEYNIEETNKKINDILDRLKVLNLQDSVFDLKTLVDYYEKIYTDFDNERRGKRDYERGIINVSERLSKVSSILRNLYAEIDNIKDTYD